MRLGKVCNYANILYIFPYVFAMFAASPSSIMVSTTLEGVRNGGEATGNAPSARTGSQLRATFQCTDPLTELNL